MTLATLFTFLTACSGGSYNQGIDTLVKDDTGIETGEADADTDADADADSDADTDSDTDTDTGPTWEGSCGNTIDPVDLTGWTRNYDITYNGEAGTEVQTGMGEVAVDGSTAYEMAISMSAPSQAWDATQIIGCDMDGEGLFYISSTYAVSVGTYRLVNSPPQKYLPASAIIGTGADWNYSHTMSVLQQDTSTGAWSEFIPVTVTGSVTDFGPTEVTIGEETFTGYRIINSYDQSSEGIFGFFAFEASGAIDQIWVPGIGLVSEEIEQVDGSTGQTDVTITKTLSSYTGLSYWEN